MQNYVRKKHDVFICHVKDLSAKSPNLDFVPVVREYSDLFPEEISEMPLVRDVEFSINLEPGKCNRLNFQVP